VIAKLKGLLDSTGQEWAVVDVGGVGYLVFCSARTLARMPRSGGPIELTVETHVREDHIHLYGFPDEAERDWFRLLTTVQGVGAKVAMAILGVMGPDELLQAIAAGDRAGLTRAAGVGPKLASRVVAELKDKVGGIALGGGAVTEMVALAGSSRAGDAVSALVNLGYRRAEAFGAVATAARDLGTEAPVESLIRGGLRELSR
jgi:Holliday junction DNA helicase RuvA